MADVPATEEAVAAEFAIGGAAASFCGQWLCVKAGFEKKDGVVFLRDALGTKAPSDDVLKAVGDETRRRRGEEAEEETRRGGGDEERRRRGRRGDEERRRRRRRRGEWPPSPTSAAGAANVTSRTTTS